MATLAPQKAEKAGTAVGFVAAGAGGDQYLWGSNRIARVKNGGAGAITVTAVAQRPCNQGVLHDNAAAIAAGAEESIGGLERAIYADASGYVHLTYSDASSVEVAIVEA